MSSEKKQSAEKKKPCGKIFRVHASPLTSVEII
jgi:hypothetical protein